MTSPRDQLIARFHADRPLAHRVLFAHRHPHPTPPFHVEMQADWHSLHPHVLDMVFRGGAKSTIAEEALVLLGCFREFRNALIVGSNKDRAMERLHAVRREFESNEWVRKIFGDQVGPTWADEELVLANGRRILALGRGQSLRGIKFEDMRPDLVFIDDLEERTEAMDAKGRAKVYDWLIRDLLPACDPAYRVRVAATPIHPEALPMRLKKQKNRDGTLVWITHTYPIYYLGEAGEPTSSWPERFSIDRILEMESAYRTSGDISAFMSEFMCEAEAPETKAFRKEMFRIEPRVRSWQAVYSMTDPARTTNAKSATTGYAAWSWIGPKLVIWDAWARRLMPDEIVASLFQVYDDHRPVWIGIEEDGLNEFLMQPIRQEMAKRGQTIPVKALKAPKGKMDFIRGLQPFFNAREVEFVKPLQDLEDQLIAFPTGEIDAPNALAYALKMRPGAPLYDGFKGTHVAQDLLPAQGRPLWLCLNATRSLVSGVVCQAFDGCIRIYGDGLREGEPGSVLADLVAQAQLEFGRDIRLVAGPQHFDRYNNVGLVQAAARIPREVRGGVTPDHGRGWLTAALGVERRGMPAVLISENARWTLNGFAGGYARVMLKGGILADYAEEGEYRILMEGLESFVGLLDLGLEADGPRGRFNAETSNGRPYRSMLAVDAPRGSKEDWGAVLRG